VPGWASQAPAPTASGPRKAAGATVSGPYLVKPPEVVAPAEPMSFRSQYASARPDGCRGRYRPVIVNRTERSLTRSCIWITSPSATCSSVAAVSGSAAGIGPPARGGPGQCPLSRTAWVVMAVKAAASEISTLLPPELPSLPLPEPASAGSAGRPRR
jgi:hypothetical protein